MSLVFRRPARITFAVLVFLATHGSSADAQICFPPFGCGGDDGPVEVSVATDQTFYVVGDPIRYAVSAYNPADTPITLSFSSSQQADYIVDGVYSPDDLSLTVITGRMIPAKGTATWDFFHPWDDYSLVPGPHHVAGLVVGYGTSNQLAGFSVAAPDPVVDDVSIDFDHLPNGAATYDGANFTYGKIWDDAYVTHGVRFRSQGGTVNFLPTATGVMLHTPTTKYPPGFNIIAEFDMPVYSITADVGSAANQSVTMHAFDANGNALGSVTSDPTTDYPNLIGPLSFDSSVPIASVQWFSSVQNASVRIDNLFLNVDLSETEGDYNNNGVTDPADYVVFRDSYNMSVPLGSGADGNHDGIVDISDYYLWKDNFNWRGPSASLAVPEPSAAVLALSLLPLVTRLRRRYALLERDRPADPIRQVCEVSLGIALEFERVDRCRILDERFVLRADARRGTTGSASS